MGEDARRSGGYERNEGEAQRLDRNYSEQLQELRVAETGVQILFAFLLGISFQQRFAQLSDLLRAVYILTLLWAAVAAALFIAPVALHRAIFRQHRKHELVAFTARLASVGLLFLALSMLGALLLIVDFVVGPLAAWLSTAGVGALFLWLWFLMPRRLSRKLPQPRDEPPA